MDSKDKNKNIYDQAMDARKADLSEHSDNVREIEKENAERTENMKVHAPEDIKSDFDLTEIKADLSLFELKDSGSEYLKVYHPAIDTGTELGIISKEEYGKLKNKEAFFKSTLENHAATPEIEQRHILAFEGEFVEPTVTEEVVDEKLTANDYEKKAFQDDAKMEKLWESLTDIPFDEDPEGHSDQLLGVDWHIFGKGTPREDIWEYFDINYSKGLAALKGLTDDVRKTEFQDDSLPQAKMTDEYEKSVQMETQKTESDYNNLSTNIINNLYTQLKHNMKFDSVSILTAKYNDDKTSLNVYASLHDKIGEKFVSLDIPVEGITFKPLSNSTVASIVAKTADLGSKISKELKGEVDDKVKQIEADEDWKLRDVKDIVDSHDAVNPEDFIEEKFQDYNDGEEHGSYTVEELDAMPTISQGHMDNLKVDDGKVRVWLSRMTVADGMEYDNQVTVEELVEGIWTTINEYQALEASQKSKVTKKAETDSGGVGFSLSVDILNIAHNLTGLPDDMEIGTTVFIDGYHWKLTSKGKHNLSKEKDSGSIWTFTKVPVGDKEPEHTIDI